MVGFDGDKARCVGMDCHSAGSHFVLVGLHVERDAQLFGGDDSGNRDEKVQKLEFSL